MDIAVPVEPSRARVRAALVAFARGRWPLLGAALSLVAKQFGVVLALGLAPGPLFAVASLAAAVSVLAPALALRGRAQLAALAVLDLAASGLLLADLLYFRHFGDVVSAAALRMIGELPEQAQVVAELWRATDALFLADVPLIAALLVAPAAARARWLAPAPPRAVVLACVAAFTAAGFVATTDPTRHFQQKGHSWPVKRLGPLTFHGKDLLASFARRVSPRRTGDGEVRAIRAALDARRERDRRTPNPLRGAAAGKNLIVIQVESLQGFVLGARLHGEPIAPNLEALARESLVFPRFHHQAGAGVTSDADLLFNCSLYPQAFGSAYYENADSDFRCLPRILSDHGYGAFALQAIRPDFWNLAAVYPRVGYERFFSRRDFVEDDVHGHGVADESFLRQALPRLEAFPEPYLAFLVTLTSHVPFDRGDPMPPGPLDGTRLARYAAAIHQTDRAIGAFVEALRARGILDRSVLVVYGDHLGLSRGAERYDERLSADGAALAAFLGNAPDDDVAWTEVEKRVPLLVRLPGGAAAGARDVLAGQVDLAPTLLGLLGIDDERAPLHGVDVLAREAEAVLFPDGSALDREFLWRAPSVARLDGGCFSMRTHAPLPVTVCERLARVAALDLGRSRAILDDRLLALLYPEARL